LEAALTHVTSDWLICVLKFGQSGCRGLKQIHIDKPYLHLSIPSSKRQKERDKKSAWTSAKEQSGFFKMEMVGKKQKMETHITPYHICLCLNFLSKIFISSPK
jgi:hypothetical protein